MRHSSIASARIRGRRRLLVGSAGLLAAHAARAQAPKRPVRIGYLTGGGPSEVNLEQFRVGLRRIGWTDGRDFVVVARYANLELERFPALVDELLREGIDILVTAGTATRVAPVAQHAVPVVFTTSGDPVASGTVQSLARPGGNATGISQLSYELAGKRLEFLREAAPTARRAAVLWSPLHPGEQGERRVTEESAGRLGLGLVVHAVRDRAEVSAALDALAREGCDSFTCFPDPVTLANREAIAARAKSLRLPSVFGRREFCDVGGLVSYGPNIAEIYARVAVFVERIAGGAKPADLPVELPTAIELILNRRTARDLGVEFPPALLARADEVIES